MKRLPANPIYPVITATEAAGIVGMSRTRTSELVRAGIFPSQTDSIIDTRVIHRAEVEFWREYGRTKEWLGAMQKVGSRIAERTLLAAFVESIGDAFGKAIAAADSSSRTRVFTVREVSLSLPESPQRTWRSDFGRAIGNDRRRIDDGRFFHTWWFHVRNECMHVG